MASGKSNITAELLEFVGEDTCKETWKSALPEKQRGDMSAWQRRLQIHSPFEEGALVHTIVDGPQTIFHLKEKRYTAGTDGGGAARQFVQRTWQDAREHYTQWVRSWLLRGLSVHSEEVLVMAFDNGRKSSLAKRATQMTRRLATVRAAHSKRHRVQLPGPPDEIECAPISPHDRVPEERNTLALWSKHRHRVHEFLLDPLLVVRNEAQVNWKQTELVVWYNGVGYTPRVRREEDERTECGTARWNRHDGLTQAFEMMGEYDFFALRYAIEVVERTIAQRRSAVGVGPNEEIDNDDTRARVYNLSNLVFRLVTTDTDLLIYMLWFLEHVMMRYKVPVTDLPCVFCVRPWQPHPNSHSYILSVKKMFAQLNTSLRYADNHPGYSVRSLMSNFLAWGNDVLPSPYGVTARTAMRAYSLLNSVVASVKLCGPQPRGNTITPHAVHLNGAAFRVLFALWYGTKCLWHNPLLTKGASEESVVECLQELREKFADASVGDIEAYIYDACNGKLKHVRKKALAARGRMPHADSKVLEHRLALFTNCVYFIEHALKACPGYTISLRDIGLLSGANDNSEHEWPYYIDLHAHMREALTDRQQRLLGALGLFGEGCYLRWNDMLMQSGDAPYTFDDKSIRELGEKAESVFIWQELDTI